MEVKQWRLIQTQYVFFQYFFRKVSVCSSATSNVSVNVQLYIYKQSIFQDTRNNYMGEGKENKVLSTINTIKETIKRTTTSIY